MRAAVLLLGLCGCVMAQDNQWFSRWTLPYRASRVPPINFSNSPRIENLVRAGTIYVSLSDAIALAIENNLDVEFERFAPQIASADVLRAEGGGELRGISLAVAETPPGIGGPPGPLLNAAASGSLPGTSIAGGFSVLSIITPPSPTGIAITGAELISAGPPIPQFDPSITGSLFLQHQNTPQTTNILSGSNRLSGGSLTGNLGLTKGFALGTQLTSAFTAESQHTNSTTSIVNPNTTSSLSLTLVQPLLRGFGPAVNRRFIRIAKNNQRTSDLLFRQQLIVTVAGVIRLYSDMVSLNEDVRVKEETLALAQRLYEDNKVQVEQGTLAPVELTRAQAEVAAAQQDLANSVGNAKQEELILKTVLTRRGTADLVVRNAHLQPTTPLNIPDQEPVYVSADLVAQALRQRPEMAEAKLQIDNSHIALEGSRNELLPELDIVATGQNAALAGQPNGLSPNSIAAGPTSTPNGGLGNDLSQIFTGRFPTYSVGIQLTLPLRNRIAQADVVRDEIQIREWDILRQQLENQIRLEVEAGVVALQQARAAYDAAVQARTLQEQSLTIEMEKYSVGLSTTLLVMQYQSFVAQARSTEVAARNVYAKARTALERAIGATLENNNVSVDDAMRGKINH